MNKLSLPILIIATLFLVGAKKIGDKKGDVTEGMNNPTDKTYLVASPKKAKSSAQKDRITANIIKNALETYHYLHFKIDDKISKRAFKEFLKRLDYGKHFLLQSDVKELAKFKTKMDDQVISGNLKLINLAKKKINQRIKFVEGIRKKFFKQKKISFKGKDKLEMDPDKRSFQKNAKGLERLWGKSLRNAVLTRYLTYIDEQDESKKDKKKKKSKKKKKKKKKLSRKEMRAKAVKEISKKYKRYFARLLKDDHADFVDKFFNSVANAFDPHTTYLPPKKKEDFDIDISGSLEGIGAVLSEDGQYIKVVSIVPGGAAWRQKDLEVDDLILMVAQGDKEPVDLVDMRVDDAVRYIRGKKGTEVRLTVKKADGTRKVVPIVRDVVQIGASFATSAVLGHKKLDIKIGYIYVPKFYRDFSDSSARNCSEDVRLELEKLKKLNVDGVILDLRNNGGGSLEDARIMSGLFIERGPIVQIRNHSGNIDVLRDRDKSVTYDGPLVVMTNRYSASASEILAGAMQDYGRAVVVGGLHSHGKGTVQAILDLNQGVISKLFGSTIGALKVTIQKFYRITGASTQYKGITPDIPLPDPYGHTENREQDLENSLPWDEVPTLSYRPWKKMFTGISTLKMRTEKRIKKNKRINKIKESVAFLKKRRKETLVSLDIDKVRRDNKKTEKRIKELKLDEVNKDVLVTNFEGSLKSNNKIQKGDEKQWKEDFKQKKEEFVEGLQKDASLEETLHILEDMVRIEKKITLRTL